MRNREMVKDLEIRGLKKGDEEGVSQLFLEVVDDRKNTGYWLWKYNQNPAGDHMMIVAIDKDRIVAVFGTIPVKMKVGASTILSSQGVDIVVSPDYRTKSLFFELETAAREFCLRRNVYFCYAFSVKSTYFIFTTAARFEGVTPIFNMAKLINPTPYIQRKFGLKSFAGVLDFVGKQTIKIVGKKRLSIPEEFKIGEVTQFDRRFDDFWHEQAKNYEIVVIRDSQYLNWRYLENPEPYKVFSVEQDGCIKGFIVLKCSQEEVKRGRIIDILVELDQERIIDLLLTKAINYFFDQKVDVITCWMFENWPIFQALKKSGFIKRETAHDLMVRSFMPIPNFPNHYLRDKSKWYMTMGDSDYF